MLTLNSLHGYGEKERETTAKSIRKANKDKVCIGQKSCELFQGFRWFLLRKNLTVPLNKNKTVKIDFQAAVFFSWQKAPLLAVRALFLAAPPTRCRLGVNVGVLEGKNWVRRHKEGEEPINNSQRRAIFLEKGTCTDSLSRVERRPKALLTLKYRTKQFSVLTASF